MPSTTPHLLAFTRLRITAQKWMHRPDMDALRIVLAAAKALDLHMRPVWIMLIGPGSVGKTEFFIQSAKAYRPHEVADDLTIPGLLSGSNKNYDKGVLRRLGKRGLLLVPDFTVILNQSEDKRTAIMGVWRRIYDGEYERKVDGEQLVWKGSINVILACTNAIERYYRVHSDMGERFLSVRLDKRDACDDLAHKQEAQEQDHDGFQAEVREAARQYLETETDDKPELTFALRKVVLQWADLISLGRIGVSRNYKDEIVGVAQEEGASRASQQIMSLVAADALLQGQEEANGRQIQLVKRVAFDSIPSNRRAVLQVLSPDVAIQYHNLREMSGIGHPYTYDRTIDELEAIGAISRKSAVLGGGTVEMTERLRSLMAVSD